MSKGTLRAISALLVALGTSAYAQGQSSGEDTQRNKEQQQQSTPSGQTQSSQQPASAQSQSSSSQYGAGTSTSSQFGTSSTSPATSSSSATISPSGRLSDTSSRAQQRSTSQGSPATTQSSQQSSAGISAQGRPGDTQVGISANVNQQHVTQFQNAFSTWRAGTDNSQQITTAIRAAAPGVSQEYVTRFVTDLNTIMPRVTLSVPAQQTMARALASVVSPHVEVTQLEPTLTEVRTVLIQSGLTPIQAQTIACDLHLIAAQTHPNLLEVKVSP